MQLPVHLLALLISVPAPDGYVPDSRCASCHADIAHTFAGHGMGRSFHRADSASVLADFEHDSLLFHEPSNLHYWMRRDDDGRIWMRQFERMEDGTAINEVDVEAHWVVGSGNHAQTFLHQSPSGELWELPVTWWTDHGWDMSPGYDRADHARFSRQVGLDCIFCHTAYPDMNDGLDRLGQATAYPHEMPEGIGCQRCHGPGAAHVDLAYSADATDEAIAAAILNPHDLSPALQEDLCMQCHLQPTSRLSSLMRTTDAGFFDYRPGDPLHTAITHVDFDVPGEDGRFEVNHHGYQLQRSACWTGPGTLSCLMCHDPHATLPEVERVAMVRSACLECHGDTECRVEDVMDIPRSDAQNCGTCHMPTRRPTDAVHTLVTDHRIQLPPPDLDALVALIDEPPPPSVFTGLRHDGREGLAGPVMAEILAGNTSRMHALQSTSNAARLALGQGLMNAGRFDEAREVWLRSVEADPTSVMAQVNLAMIDAQDGRVDHALERVNTVLLDQPDAVDARALRARLLEQSNPHAAMDDASRVAADRTTLAEPLRRLGSHLASQGHMPEAAQAFGRAEALEPGDADNAYNLGLALFRAGDVAGAARAWRHALTRSPNDLKLLRMAALTTALPYVGTSPDPNAALPLADRLARLDPASGTTQATLAAVQLAAGLTDRAIVSVAAAAHSERDLAVVRMLEALLLNQQGQRREAATIFDRVRRNAAPEGVLRIGLMGLCAQALDP